MLARLAPEWGRPGRNRSAFPMLFPVHSLVWLGNGRPRQRSRRWRAIPHNEMRSGPARFGSKNWPCGDQERESAGLWQPLLAGRAKLDLVVRIVDLYDGLAEQEAV